MTNKISSMITIINLKLSTFGLHIFLIWLVVLLMECVNKRNICGKSEDDEINKP